MKSSRSLLLFLKGMAMGAGDIVPGVSGGTIAFITGIYEELIASLRSINLAAIKILLNEGIPAAWKHINGNFLLTVFAGILFSVFSLAPLVGVALEHYPIIIWSFFFGLILASSYHLFRQLSDWRWHYGVSFTLGLVLCLIIINVKPAELPPYWWVLMIGGGIAICAMILPGVSGAFLLVLMGLYPVVLAAISELNWALLVSFGAGCAVGLLAFSHVLFWLLQHYHNETLVGLVGFLLASLVLVWPWKRVVSTYTDSHGEIRPLIQENILPTTYSLSEGSDSQLILSLLAMAFGLLVVLGLERVGRKH